MRFWCRIAVFHGAGRSPVLQHSSPALLAALEQTGIPATRLVPTGDAVVTLWLADRGWESANLAALVAAARAAHGEVLLEGGQPDHPLARAAGKPDVESHRRMPLRLTDTGWHPSAALLDRDGTLIVDRHYLRDPKGVTLLPGVAVGLRLLAEYGIPAAVLTNQSGVARGLISNDELVAVHARLEALLESEGIRLAGIFACPHAPADRCRCRKPEPGLAQQAAAALGVDLGRAMVAGDRQSDLDLGRRLGVPAILIYTGGGPATPAAGGAAADYLVDDLAELARICTHPAGLPLPPRTL